jgi:large subunit ribosomal protein L32
MPNPKRRFSKTRTKKKRTHYKAVIAQISLCSNCGAPVRYHRVCDSCGYYKGKEAIAKEKAV